MLIRVAGSIVLTVLLAVLASAPIFAHAQLVSVDPADGAVLDVAPRAVVVTFNEPVNLAPGGVRVLDGAGEAQDDGPDQTRFNEIRQPVRDLPAGTYAISWSIISQDGHLLRESTVFTVRDADGEASTGSTAGPPAVVVTRGAAIVGPARTMADLGILVATGAAAAWFLLGARSRWISRLIALATIAAIVASIDVMAIQWIDGGAAWLDTIAAQTGLLRILILGLALATAWRAPVIAGAALIVATLTIALGGHSTGLDLATTSEMAHLAAAAVWLGAAPAVLVEMWDRGIDEHDAMLVVRRFSRLAGVAIVIVGLAGLVLTIQLSDAFAAGFTPWLATLALKVGLVVVAVLVGAYGRRALAREPRRGRYRWLFAVDAVILVGVVILSASLTTTAPTRQPSGSAASVMTDEHAAETDRPGSVAVCQAPEGAEFLVLEADPGRAGSNELELRHLDSADAAAVELGHATIEGAPLRVQLAQSGASWQGSATIPFAGAWAATVVARLDTFTERRWACRLVVAE